MHTQRIFSFCSYIKIITLIALIVNTSNLFSQTIDWLKAQTPKNLPEDQYGTGYNYITESNNGIFYSAAYGDPNLAFQISYDKGLSWSSIKVANLVNGVSTILCTDSNTVLIGSDGGGLKRSTDNGITFVNVIGYYFRISCIEKDNEGNIYVGTLPGAGGAIYRSTDDGKTWLSIAYDLNYQWIHSIKALNNGHIFVGAYSGIYLSKDKGTTWSKTTLNGSYDVRKIVEGRNGRIFALSSNRGIIYHTDDYGLTWNNSFTLNKERVILNLCIDTNNFLYAGVSGGLYRSVDNGVTWQKLNFPKRDVTSLYFSQDKRLFAGSTDGIYVWNKMPKYEDNEQIVFNCYPNPLTDFTRIQIFTKVSTEINVTIYNVLGQKVESFKDNIIVAGQHSFIWEANNLATGIYIAKISTDRKAIYHKLLVLK